MSIRLSDFDIQMSAIAFAEAGEHETARKMLNQGSSLKPSRQTDQKNKPYLKTLVLGTISISAYVFLLKNQDLITTNYTMGGWHTVLPVGTAFFFSFVHGAFASNFLNLLGIKAKK